MTAMLRLGLGTQPVISNHRPGASARDTITVKATRAGRALVLGGAESSSPDPNPFNTIALATITISR